MPYEKGEVPTAVKNLPPGAQSLFKKAFNACWRENADENQCRQAGWANIKREYKKISEGNWVAKK